MIAPPPSGHELDSGADDEASDGDAEGDSDNSGDGTSDGDAEGDSDNFGDGAANDRAGLPTEESGDDSDATSKAYLRDRDEDETGIDKTGYRTNQVACG